MRQGKWTVGSSNQGLGHGTYGVMVKDTSEVVIKDLTKNNAKEIVRRWNAFEDGGIVEELKVACDVGLDSMRGMLEMAIKIGASNKDKKEHAEHIEFVEAALAKS